MAKFLPERIFPLRLANLGQHLIGSLAVGQMTRLIGDGGSGEWPKGKGDIQVDLQFQRGERSNPRISGSLNVTLTFECQRCLEPVDIDVAATVDLGLVGGARLPTQGSEEDYLELSEESVNLATLVEDELILALPIIPTHPVGICDTHKSNFEQNDKIGESTFAALSALKSKSK